MDIIDLSITVPSAPGPVIPSQSNFAHDNLQIKWTAPVNTVVTKYELTIDGSTYTTMNNDSGYQFTGKVFIPGHFYVISIVTVSGTTSDIVKKSSKHTEWIRITPTSKRNTINVLRSTLYIDRMFFINQLMCSLICLFFQFNNGTQYKLMIHVTSLMQMDSVVLPIFVELA